ncbi:MAG: dienelactone hydrolase family protein [Planctomycetes bacterium]|nr:dienelactone hydrolase family protein [Planctomycetota bacterium]
MANTASTPMPGITRRKLMQAAACAALGFHWPTSSAAADEVSWLADVQQPPAKLPPETPRLSSLLTGSQGQSITTLADWQVERRRLRQQWLDFLGPMPAERPPLQLEVLREESCPGGTRQLVRYHSEIDLPVEGYLLRPGAEIRGRDRRSTLRAGLVALHQTSHSTIEEIAGVQGPPAQHLGLKLMQRGFVVFCPRCFLWQSVTSFQEAVETFSRRHPGTLGMHKMLWDAQRGVDVLASLSREVDPQRIGAVGHSLGAKEALYLAAFDDRIAAAVASEGGIGFPATNWDAPWYLGPGIKAPDFPRNHHELLALIAPRPFLILGGETGPGAADGDRSWPYLEAALPVYRLYRTPARLGLYNHHEGHTISDATLVRLTQWLETYLGVG